MRVVVNELASAITNVATERALRFRGFWCRWRTLLRCRTLGNERWGNIGIRHHAGRQSLREMKLAGEMLWTSVVVEVLVTRAAVVHPREFLRDRGLGETENPCRESARHRGWLQDRFWGFGDGLGCRRKCTLLRRRFKSDVLSSFSSSSSSLTSSRSRNPRCLFLHLHPPLMHLTPLMADSVHEKHEPPAHVTFVHQPWWCLLHRTRRFSRWVSSSLGPLSLQFCARSAHRQALPMDLPRQMLFPQGGEDSPVANVAEVRCLSVAGAQSRR